MVLTRLLFPEAFGLMALVYVVLTGLEMISDVGIQPSIVQHARGNEPSFLNTAWTLQVIRGVTLWVGGLVAGVLFAWIYEQPELVQLVPIAAAAAAIAGFNSTKLATLNRRMNIAPMVLIELVAQIAALLVMIGLALAYRSIWALVAGGLVSALTKMVLSHFVLSGIRNRFQLERSAVREIVRFGKWILLSTFVTFLALRVDILLLGRLLPIELLGVYSIAGLLAVLPQQVASRLSMAVLFPILSAAARESDGRFATRLRSARGILLPIAMFIVLGIALLAPSFFRYLYDERYHGAGWMAQLLMVFVWFQLLQSIGVRVVLALGDSRSIAISNVFRLLFAVAGCLVGFHLAELPGFILGAGVGSLIGYLFLLFAMLQHELPVGWDDLQYSLGGAVFGLVGCLGPKMLSPVLGWQNSEVLELGFAALVLLPTGLFVVGRAHQLWRSGLRG
jgi:O-antigen/teichoic acid export membrane protein